MKIVQIKDEIGGINIQENLEQNNGRQNIMQNKNNVIRINLERNNLNEKFEMLEKN